MLSDRKQNRLYAILGLVSMVLFFWYIGMQWYEISSLRVRLQHLEGNNHREAEQSSLNKSDMETRLKDAEDRAKTLEETNRGLSAEMDSISRDNETLKTENASLKVSLNKYESSGTTLAEQEARIKNLAKERDDLKNKYEKAAAYQKNYPNILRSNKEKDATIATLTQAKDALEAENQNLKRQLTAYRMGGGRRIPEPASISIGDSREKVRSVLGNPLSISKYPDFEYWRYDGGRSVEFDRYGRVSDTTNIRTNSNPSSYPTSTRIKDFPF